MRITGGRWRSHTLKGPGRGVRLRPTPDARDRDLAAYVLAHLGPVQAPTGDRPTAILVQARVGDPAARSALSSAGERDPLVLHLAILDPDLATLVQ